MSEPQLKLVTNEGGKQRQGKYTNECQGLFYVAQVAPEHSQSRIKLGFSTCIETRMVKHRVVSPNIKLLRTWECRKKWERVGIDYLSRSCTPVGSEVYECYDIPSLLKLGDKLFGLFEGKA